ncbi:MAG: fructose-1,6-bisphosphatase [Clostridia bacterium]|nr:fructose-1,6-bisphosphatase [Clostridia bacterium]
MNELQNRTEIYELLSKQYKNAQEVMTEIINLQAILNLPKGTEHFLSDLHGESEAFRHILKNASGVIRTKIDLAFGDGLTVAAKNELATLIYYPEKRLEALKKQTDDMTREYRIILHRLIEVAKLVAAKYTRSKVRKALPRNYQYIIDELINMPDHSIVKSEYYSHIIEGIIELGNADKFIAAISGVISRLAVDHMHIVGDIYDRGNGAAQIMDMLKNYHSVDIQWGNHDLLWMGAHFGNKACVCNVIRINCAYRTLAGLESGYGINLRPLVTFALEEYGDDDTSAFSISDVYGKESDFEKNDLLAKMTKAITVIQLKIENQLIKAHPEFEMDDRILYPSDTLTEKESALIDILTEEFVHNKRLAEDIGFMLAKGSMYKIANGNLLLHGCIPTEEDGSFSYAPVGKEKFAGKALYDRLEKLVRDASKKDGYSVDYMWYLWCGKKSPVYGRDKMCVYTRYFEGRMEIENKDKYYDFVKDEGYCVKVLKEFGLDWEYSTIVNGHVPVKVKDGERADSGKGRHITIDGGFSKAYHEKTGIGGYTLIHNSQGLFLASHSPDFSKEEAENGEAEFKSSVRTVKLYRSRVLVKETDKGRAMQKQIEVLKNMLHEYYKV